MGFRDVVDVGLVALGLWAVIAWLRHARAGSAALGALALTSVYLVARELRLNLTAWVFRGFFVAFLIALIVLLQGDLRRTFERLTLMGRGGRKRGPMSPGAGDALCDAVFELAARKWGALIVLPGRDRVDRYVEDGYELSGRLSRALLISLFDPGSPGHDGAVIVLKDLVNRFGARLPLSSNSQEIRERGTRHAAALGLSEVIDAICVVVSEERGEVLIARDGRLVGVRSPDALQQAIREHYAHADASYGTAPPARFSALRRHGLEGAAAIGMSIGLWLVFVPSAELSERTFRVAVQVEGVGGDYRVEAIEPQDIDVTLQGEAMDLFLLDPTELRVRLDASELAQGRRTFQLSESSIRRPDTVRVTRISPTEVALHALEGETALPPADEAAPPAEGGGEDTGQQPQECSS